MFICPRQHVGPFFYSPLEELGCPLCAAAWATKQPRWHLNRSRSKSNSPNECELVVAVQKTQLTFFCGGWSNQRLHALSSICSDDAQTSSSAWGGGGNRRSFWKCRAHRRGASAPRVTTRSWSPWRAGNDFPWKSVLPRGETGKEGGEVCGGVRSLRFGPEWKSFTSRLEVMFIC